MDWLYWSLLGLVATILIFVITPGLVSYFTVFARKSATPLDRQDLVKAGFGTCASQITQALPPWEQLPLRPVAATACDGQLMVAEYCPGTNGRTVIFFHGYRACPRNNFFKQAVDFYQQGYGLLLVHQRGHNESGGTKTTFGLKERYDVLTWVDWVLTQDPNTKIMLYGTSMGAATVAYASPLLPRQSVIAMVLDSGFVCPYDMLAWECKKRSAPYQLILPMVRRLMKKNHGLDLKETTIDSLARTDVPALFLCGTADETVPDAIVRDAYDHCSAEKELIVVPNAPHTMAYLVGGSAVKAQLFAFADRFFAPQQGEKR